MEIPKQTRERLRGILDRLGPGLFLKVEEPVLRIAFGGEDPKAVATTFASSNHCAFWYERGARHGERVGVFGRASQKRFEDIG